MSDACAAVLHDRYDSVSLDGESQATGLRGELREVISRLSALSAQHGLTARVERLLREAGEAVERFQPAAMVFGPYNAGKSTLLNALLRRDAARVSDAPCTSSIDAWQFGDWTIYDTPGIDAPIIHEAVTREHLARCQVVIVVLSTAGSTEEDRTIAELRNLRAMDKELIVVLNNKSGTTDHAELARIREKLESAAFGSGGENRRVPILLVNAMTALRGREPGKEKLYELSGVPDLAALLPRVLRRSGGDRALLPVFEMLASVVAALRTDLGEVTLSAEEARLRQLLLKIRASRAEFHRLMETDLAGLRATLTNRLETAICNRADQGPALAWYLEQADGSVTRRLDLLFGELGESFPELARPAIEPGVTPAEGLQECDLATSPQSAGLPVARSAGASALIDPKMLPNLLRGPQAREVAKEGLLFLRGLGVPGIKGRWARTLDRWAGNICRGAGAFLEVGIAVWQWQEASRAQAAYEAAQVDARRRVHRSAEDLAAACEAEVLNQSGEIGRQAFAPLETRVEQELLGARGTLDRRQRDLLALDGLEDRLKGVRPKVG